MRAPARALTLGSSFGIIGRRRGRRLANALVPVITITGLPPGAIIAFAVITEIERPQWNP